MLVSGLFITGWSGGVAEYVRGPGTFTEENFIRAPPGCYGPVADLLGLIRPQNP